MQILKTTNNKITNNNGGTLPMLTIIVDTREQDAYEFPGGDVLIIKQKLDAGDYSLVDHERHVAVERKNLDDFVKTVVLDMKRFRMELKALEKMDFAAVVVEGTIQDILSSRYKLGVHPQSVIGATAAIMMDYGVPIIFAGTRAAACHMTRSLLERYARTTSYGRRSRLEVLP